LKRLEGVIVPVATPLMPDESLDRSALNGLVERLIGAGVHGLFANGSMGGFAFHSDRMQIEIIEAVATQANRRCPVLGGVSDTSLGRVLSKLRDVETLPVDAVVVLPPLYFLYKQDELSRFFLEIAERSRKPLVVYENPRLVQNSLAPETIARIASHPNVVGVKHSGSDSAVWQQMFAQQIDRSRCALICGAEKAMAQGLRLGFTGMTGGFHNVMPAVAVELYQASQRRDWELCEQLQSKLNRGYRIFELAGGWRGLEAALQWLGIARKTTVRPFDEPVPEHIQQAITAILEQEVERSHVTFANT
jgi:dihydrodipicolinate synthase/N-acetylneuraminate lyase